nr:hypothetical protein [Pseudonocardia lacus]
MTQGAPGAGGQRCGAAEHRERGLGPQPLGVVPGGDQELSGDVGSDPDQRGQGRVDLGDQRGDEGVEIVDLGGELLVAPGECAQRDEGGGGRVPGCGVVGPAGGAGRDEFTVGQGAQPAAQRVWGGDDQ